MNRRTGRVRATRVVDLYLPTADKMHIASHLLSFLLHAVLFLLAVLWPTYKPIIPPDSIIYNISLVEGAPGGEGLPTPVLGPRAVKASANPQPDLGGADLPGESKAVDEIKSLEQAPDNKPQVQEAKAPPSEEAKKPQPEEIKAADSKDTKKPEVKADPKPDPKKETKPTAKTQTPQEALEEMKRQAAKKEQQAVADALRGFDKDVKGRAGSGGSGGSGSGGGGGLIGGGPGGVGGGGGEGDGPGGGGINDVYRGLVLMTIQPHWSWHGDDRKPLTALVRVQTDPQGRVIHTAIEQSSGNAEFDASVMNVFVRVPELPKPPTPAQQDLILYFNSQELRG